MHTLLEVLSKEDSAISFVKNDKGIAEECYFVERNTKYPWLYFYYKNGVPQSCTELSVIVHFIPVAYDAIWW